MILLIKTISVIVSAILIVFGIDPAFNLKNIGGMASIGAGVCLFILTIFSQRIALFIKSTILGRVLFIIAVIMILLFVVVEILIISKEFGKYEKQADAVIILGSGLFGDQVSLNLSYRLDAAIEYINKYPDAIIVVAGGQGPRETITEAEAMKRYLVKHGVAEEKILKEDKSTSTAENIRFSKEILDEKLGSSYDVVCITTDFHVFRAEQIAKKQGLTATGIPAKDVWYLKIANHFREFVSVMNFWLFKINM
jgi:uncharacterized SAM-binding protein YcdF (DUF218 family)